MSGVTILYRFDWPVLSSTFSSPFDTRLTCKRLTWRSLTPIILAMRACPAHAAPSLSLKWSASITRSNFSCGSKPSCSNAQPTSFALNLVPQCKVVVRMLHNPILYCTTCCTLCSKCMLSWFECPHHDDCVYTQEYEFLCCCHFLPVTILWHTLQCFLLNVQLPQLMHLWISLSIDAMIDWCLALTPT